MTGPLNTLPLLRRLLGSDDEAAVGAARAGATGLALGFFGNGAIVFFPDGLIGGLGVVPLAAAFLPLALFADFPVCFGDDLACGFAFGFA